MNDPYTDISQCVTRLCRDFQKYGNLAIGFDFDDTIFDYHQLGHSYHRVMELLRRASKLGLTMCLYTNEMDPCRLKFKVDFCKHALGFSPDYVNESPLLKGGGKPFFSILLDDRAGLGHACITLESTLDMIEKNRVEVK